MFELQEELEFIVCKIQKLFEQRNQNIILLIKRLKVLAAWLECYLTFKSSEDASFLLHTDFIFLNMIFISKSSRDLAEWYMIQNVKIFDAAYVEDFLSSTNQIVHRLRVEREALQKNVRKYVIVESDLNNFIDKVVKISRFTCMQSHHWADLYIASEKQLELFFRCHLALWS